MKKRLIYLLRHGEIDNDGKKRFIGQADWPLNEMGLSQARRLRMEFSGFRLGGIFCSDLNRSKVTAEIIAEKHRVRPVVSADLREISLGTWEGLSFDEVRRQLPVEFTRRGKEIATYVPEGGESFRDCQERVMQALNDILASTRGNLLIVGHAGVNRTVLCQVLGMPLENIFRLAQDYGCINTISAEKSGFRLQTMNRVSRIVDLSE